MSWMDRLKEAAYTSPSGKRATFQYVDVSRSIDKKTSGFTFPDLDGTLVQDLGHTGRRYPLRLFFSGGDYDIEVAAFEELLLERGAGLLEHPIYGNLNVVPFGTISRSDNLTTASNQAILQVEFWDTLGTVQPMSATDPATDVLNSVTEYNNATAEAFAEIAVVQSASGRATLRGQYAILLASVDSLLSSIADTNEATAAQFDAVLSSITLSLDTLVADPVTLAFQTNILLQTPARSSASILARLDAYSNLINTTLSSSGNVDTQMLYAAGAVAASVVSVVNNTFETKPEAIEAADALLTQFDTVNTWGDDNRITIDTGESYQQLLDAVAIAAGFLVEISFSLKQERRITLTRPRALVDLTAELYGEVDEKLDFMINSNELSGSEILELPRGRDIVYYV